MEIHTPRLLLRELALTDAAALNAIEADPRVSRYMSYEPQSPTETVAYITQSLAAMSAAPRRVYDLGIETTAGEPGACGSDGRAFIGRCGLGVARPEHREASAWYLLRPDVWGRGYAVEAAEALIAFGFSELKLHRVWVDCDPRNTASCRVAEKLGMTFEGRLRENYWLKGEWCDTAVYAVLEHEWAARKRPGP